MRRAILIVSLLLIVSLSVSVYLGLEGRNQRAEESEAAIQIIQEEKKSPPLLRESEMITTCAVRGRKLPNEHAPIIGNLEADSLIHIQRWVGNWAVSIAFHRECFIPGNQLRNISWKNEVVVIDPGHQKNRNSEQEPIGPGAAETKDKVSSGTSGEASGLNEYELTLMISTRLRDTLIKRGYRVSMTRTTNDVDLSNAERAELANQQKADVFLRIHANGSEDKEREGAMTICQTEHNPYNGGIYAQCRALSQCVLDCLVEETGCKKETLWETDTMSGINWCKVPVTIVEVGYMSNPREDLLLAAPGYQQRIADGIANGVDLYFSTQKPNHS